MCRRAGNGTPPGVDVPAADQAHRIARCRRVERPGGGRAPVNELELVIVIAQADTADVKSVPLLVVGAAKAQSTLGQVELGEPLRVLGRGNIPFQPGLVGAAGRSVGAHARQLPLAALPCLVKQAVEHTHVILLRPHGRGVADGRPHRGASRVSGFRGRRVSGAFLVSPAYHGAAFSGAFRCAFSGAFRCASRCVFRSGRLRIRLTNCHDD
jgi:hypothetical protein